MEKRIALFEVKSLEANDPNGEFEAILSMPTLDRDGEVIDAKAFEPLPATIPIHAFHDFSSPVAVATPFYDGDILKGSGVFDPDPAAQTLRSKVGRSVRFMSVGFMATTRKDVDGVPHITKAELLEASFVSVPSNREAAILAVKAHRDAFEMKASKGDRLQQIHDLSVANGAACESKAAPVAEEKSPTNTTDPETNAAAPAAADPPAEVIVDPIDEQAMRAHALSLAATAAAS